jgi:dynein intermediate chain 1, axonemal
MKVSQLRVCNRPNFADDKDEEKQKKSLRNQFFYQERTSQTFNLPIRERGMKTDPPKTSTYGIETTQWMVFDGFMRMYEMERLAEEEASKGKGKDKNKQQAVQVQVEDPLYSASMKRCLKIMERMLVQNADYEKFSDYKYYEDTTDDANSESFGSVLPLWRFTTEKARRKNVTAMCWNPRYKDMFTVAYGAYDFLKQTSGLICCFTIKNPTWPEYTFTTESGVMCIDIHPNAPALIAVGCYDGTVMVFDIRLKTNSKPIYQSTVRTSKHTDPVWQVKWHTDETAKNMSFYSISSDGRVTNWSLMKNKLEAEEVVKLTLMVDHEKELNQEKKEQFQYGLAGGMCFDFSPHLENLFLVGTEEGYIHLCSTAYSGQYQKTYKDHYLAVYAVKWNTFHKNVFLSCSADWTVKMWLLDLQRPIISYDLGNPIGDIAWAPYSSTVFSAVTSEGKLYVYDLDQNWHKYLCEQPTTKRAKALHVAFNDRDPIILVGDERGGVISFKLSKSLTKVAQRKDAEDTRSREELEIAKMDAFLSTQDKVEY